jgi:L-ornithine Nalpha-acyltransferase
MVSDDAALILRLAEGPHDLWAAQRLRYEVFVAELGARGPTVDHEKRLEADDYDAVFDHLILVDPRRQAEGLPHVVGAYRLLPSDRLGPAGRFYSEAEFDLDVLRRSGRRLLELGRSCVHHDFRGGASMFRLWNGLADYVLERDIDILFGVASFHGTDPAALAQPLSYLHHFHRATEAMRVQVRAGPDQLRLDLVAAEGLDQKQALAAMPALIKAYLRLGGAVGQGAFIDRNFNTTDVCLVMDTERMSVRHREYYVRRSQGLS